MKNRKLSRRILSVLMVALLSIVWALSGCSGSAGSSSSTPSSTGNSSASTSEGSKSESAKEESAEPESPEGGSEEDSGKLFSEPVELTYFGAMWAPYSADQDSIRKLIEEKTGATIHWEWTPTDTLADKLSSVLASGDIPEIIGAGPDGSIVNMLVNQGALVPLDDYMETDMPDYAALITEEDGPYVKLAADGKQYVCYVVFNYPPLNTFMVRTDWIENVGMEMPTDWEGWLDLWRAFRDQDANGDGDPNNEIPFAHQSGLGALEMICGIKPSWNFSVYPDNSYGIVSEHPNYELFLDTARMMYEEGLLDKEFQTRADDPSLFAIMDNNTLGTTFTTAERAKLSTQVNAEVDEDAFWQSIVPIPGPNGDQMLSARGKFTYGATLTIGAVQKGTDHAAAQLLNYFYTEEGALLRNYGEEGVHHDIVDGKVKLREPYINGFLESREAGLIDQTIPFNWLPENYEMILLQGKSYDELDPAGQTFVDGLTINDDYYFASPPLFTTQTGLEKGADLWAQFGMIRDNYITGQISKDEYNSQYKSLKAAGLDQINAEVSEVWESVQ